MLAPDTLIPFLGAAVLVTVAPGPDNLMVLSVGASRGRLAGMAFGLGCALGCLSHTLLAALGVSAAIAASPVAFTVLRVLGGLYLVRLGWLALRSRGEGPAGGAAPPQDSPARFFRRGLLANAINPKVILFFLAFLPQFVRPDRGEVPWQIVQLGGLFTLQAVVLFGALGYFAGQVGRWLGRYARAGLWLDRTAGAIFLLLGVKLVASF
ncbi:MAG TPA: LysE family translocator [Casimicrobiaceae bacterium]